MVFWSGPCSPLTLHSELQTRAHSRNLSGTSPQIRVDSKNQGTHTVISIESYTAVDDGDGQSGTFSSGSDSSNSGSSNSGGDSSNSGGDSGSATWYESDSENSDSIYNQYHNDGDGSSTATDGSDSNSNYDNDSSAAADGSDSNSNSNYDNDSSAAADGSESSSNGASNTNNGNAGGTSFCNPPVGCTQSSSTYESSFQNNVCIVDVTGEDCACQLSQACCVKAVCTTDSNGDVTEITVTDADDKGATAKIKVRTGKATLIATLSCAAVGIAIAGVVIMTRRKRRFDENHRLTGALGRRGKMITSSFSYSESLDPEGSKGVGGTHVI